MSGVFPSSFSKLSSEQLKDQWGLDRSIDKEKKIAYPELKYLIELVGAKELNNKSINYYLKRVIDASRRNARINSYTTHFFFTLDASVKRPKYCCRRAVTTATLLSPPHQRASLLPLAQSKPANQSPYKP